MKIRYVVSLGGVEPRQSNEKQKNGKWVWYDVPDNEAVRLVDAGIAVYEDEKEYTKAKENYAALEAQEKQVKQKAETLANLKAFESELDAKKEQYKALAVEIKALDARIKLAKGE